MVPNCSAFRKRNRFGLQTYEAALSVVLERLSLTLSRNLALDFTHYLSERPEMSFQDESSRKATSNRKKNKMNEKKAKKTIKLRDLEPTKDVIGGNRRLLRQREDPRPAPRGGYGIHKLQ